VANFAKDQFGFVAPFDASLTLLILGSLVIFFTWEENFGDETATGIATFKKAWTILTTDIKIIMLGLIQSLFEGAMFTFVFMWTPALTQNEEDVDLPHGWIFASFMVCVMMGSSIFKLLIERAPPENFMRFTFIVSLASLAVPIFILNKTVIFFSFLVFECTVGVFWPALGTMRSKYIPEESRATIMNFFRIPLNAIVVTVLFNVGSIETTVVFMFCCGFMILCTVCQQILYASTFHLPPPPSKEEL